MNLQNSEEIDLDMLIDDWKRWKPNLTIKLRFMFLVRTRLTINASVALSQIFGKIYWWHTENWSLFYASGLYSNWRDISAKLSFWSNTWHLYNDFDIFHCVN